jgi:glucose-6-phosphate 1-dehydrogenase
MKKRKKEKKICTLDECTFIILGATGDLSKRKLIPAIYKLIADKQLCKFSLVTIAQHPKTITDVLDQAKSFITNLDQKVWDNINAHAAYYQMDFHDKQAYHNLHAIITQTEKEYNLVGNRVFYLATMPHHFHVITQNLIAHNIIKKTAKTQNAPWSRVVYEKPFGFDIKSAKAINRTITHAFCESQVFRIDHYLGKELVGNIALVRFTNRIFEPLWNKNHIESIHITISEDIGVENRGAFYDSYGAIKDMVQSHLLQITALIAMEAPKHLSADFIRASKAQVLKKIKILATDVGQYAGYHKEPNVNPKSQTETFALIKLIVNNKRWQGVPFYLKTGKFLPKRESHILIKFKPVKCLLDFCPRQTNYLKINIHPDEGVYLGLNAKIPGQWNEVMPVSMDFCHSCLFGPNTPEAYETLLLDVLKGDQSAFVRSDEILLSWKIVQEIEKKRTPLKIYPRGSDL